MVNIITDLFRQIADSVKQFAMYKDKRKSNKCTILLLTDNRQIMEHPGLLSDDRELLLAPLLKRSFYKPIIYYKDRSNYVFVPENNHGSEVDHEIIKNVARAQKYKIYHKWFLYDKWITTKTYLAEGSCDFNLFMNKWSISMSSQTNAIIQAKNLSFLFEMSNTKQLLSLLVTFFVGVTIGMLIT